MLRSSLGGSLSDYALGCRDGLLGAKADPGVIGLRKFRQSALDAEFDDGVECPSANEREMALIDHFPQDMASFHRMIVSDWYRAKTMAVA